MALENLIRVNALDPNPLKFEGMTGVLPRRGEQLQALERLGLDDTEWRRTGVRARSGRLITASYHPGRSNALSYLDLAYGMIGLEREVVKFGQLYGLYTIESVSQQGDMIAVQNAIGTYLDNCTIRMSVAWTMRLMPTP